jgi:hypothetical protein
MILIIRGHIRKSFENKQFYNFIKKIYEIYPTLEIYIKTWSIFANNISWREIEVNDNIVTEDTIYTYFDDLKHLIKNIIIDDDTKINLIGNLEGNVGSGPMKLIGWKNYWYGKYQIINHIYNKNIDANEPIVNLRFDILNNSNNFNGDSLIEFINKNSGVEFTKNSFLNNDDFFYGIDNIYMGNINTMYKLIHHFYYELDDILKERGEHVFNQEFLVYVLNNILFG